MSYRIVSFVFISPCFCERSCVVGLFVFHAFFSVRFLPVGLTHRRDEKLVAFSCVLNVANGFRLFSNNDVSENKKYCISFVVKKCGQKKGVGPSLP
jgi:hypothetical protein